uniref:Beta-defensin-like domain-containing protein n=1 Tax=Salvator merianae TaxID=96440 RepID=A0A8D0B684_SALMN
MWLFWRVGWSPINLHDFLSTQYLFNLIYAHADCSGIRNGIQCRNAGGYCFKIRCSSFYTQIGTCSWKDVCCR